MVLLKLDLVYMFCKSLNPTPNEDFAVSIDSLFDSIQNESKEDEANTDSSSITIKPRIIFSYYFSHVDSSSKIENNLNKDIIPENLLLISGSNAKLDFDYHCSQVY